MYSTIRQAGAVEVATAAGIGLATYYERRKHPERFRLAELYGIRAYLRIPEEELRRAL